MTVVGQHILHLFLECPGRDSHGLGGQLVDGRVGLEDPDVVDGEDVFTPPLGNGVLPGITRAHVLALGGRERRITVDELRAAREVFVTSAIRGVVAVTRLDGNARAPGPVTARIADAYAREMAERAQQFVVNRPDRG